VKSIWHLGTIPNTLYIFSESNRRDQEVTLPPLSRAKIATLTGCPPNKDDRIENSARFDNPRPTALAGDDRYVDICLRSDRNVAGAGTADVFCTRRGYSGAIDWDTSNLDEDGAVAMHIGDNSICANQCQVFTRIVYE
jgi:hypothetical protein